MSDKTAATGRTMADVLAAHRPGAGTVTSLDHTLLEHCDCGWIATVTDRRKSLAAHQADALAQAGYGDVRALLHDLHQLAARNRAAADILRWDEEDTSRANAGLLTRLAGELEAVVARHTPPANDRSRP